MYFTYLTKLLKVKFSRCTLPNKSEILYLVDKFSENGSDQHQKLLDWPSLFTADFDDVSEHLTRSIRNSLRRKSSRIGLLQRSLNTRVSQKFCNILSTWGTIPAFSGCFRWGREGNQSHWIMRCWARLIFSKGFWPNLLQWLEARLRNWRFSVNLTFPDRREFSWTICGYCDQLRLQLSHNNCFCRFVDVMAQLNL